MLLELLYGLYEGFALALLVLWTRSDAIRTSTSIPSSAITLIGYLLLSFLSYAEHTRTIRPSLVLDFYFILSILFDAARARTMWLQQYNRNIAIIFTASIVVKLVLLILEDIPKSTILLPAFRTCSPEATSGIFGRSFFWWLNELFRKAYSKTLLLEDLLPLDKHLLAGHVKDLLVTAWTKG